MPPHLAGATTASGSASFTSATATQFTTSPTVPVKTAAITVATGSTTPATEAQVYATVLNGTSNSLNALRDTIFNKSITLNGKKTFNEVPNFPSTTAKYVLAVPNAVNGVPSFRALVANDIPTLNQSTSDNAATATALSAGTDRTKLDGIATGATKNDPIATNPLANGTASAGSAAAYSRGAHVHPTQVQDNLNASTSLAPSVTTVNIALGNKLNGTQTLTLSGDVTGTVANLSSGTMTTTLATMTGLSATSHDQTAAQSLSPAERQRVV
ncbi:hypothetical protein AGMMS49525_15210 [Bacteroidia bacterium]|nr:hypothetical protein AGMMS49525_15210 [Bacteroidia bacterium]